MDQPPEQPEQADDPSPGDEVAQSEGEAVEPNGVETDPSRGEGRFEVVGAHYAGPLPPPQMLNDYNAVLPGLAERIVNMAERDQAHVHKMDRRYLTLRFTGQAAAFLIAMAGLIIGAVLISNGHNIEGLATLFGGLAPVVGAFLYRQIKNNGETT